MESPGQLAASHLYATGLLDMGVVPADLDETGLLDKLVVDRSGHLHQVDRSGHLHLVDRSGHLVDRSGLIMVF